MTPERVDQITDALDKLKSSYCADWQTSTFDLHKILHLLNPGQLNGLTTAKAALPLELKIVANVYGLTFRHNGDYCWFDRQTDADDKPV